jgi:hypothetical protein
LRVRRNAGLWTLLAWELGVIVAAALFHVKPRPAILAAFQDYGTPLPLAAALALSPSFMPAAIGAALLATLIGLGAPIGRRRRMSAVGLAVVIVSVALVFAVGASFGAIFEQR